ncbi:transcriptional regulator, TraR/DksA family [Nitrosovibrio sp. Nv17]|nr:transcriptional regulator, TraR/DksA family [Nitrosovibrio sp. Nv17]
METCAEGLKNKGRGIQRRLVIIFCPIEDMPALTQQQIDHLDELMDQRWTREFSEIRTLLSGLGEERQRVALGERAADTSDEALLDTLSAIDEALIRQNLQDVRDIAAARERIKAGTYGECIDCGSDIGHERLLAYPTAKRCIDCQREHERRTAASGGRAV